MKAREGSTQAVPGSEIGKKACREAPEESKPRVIVGLRHGPACHAQNEHEPKQPVCTDAQGCFAAREACIENRIDDHVGNERDHHRCNAAGGDCPDIKLEPFQNDAQTQKSQDSPDREHKDAAVDTRGVRLVGHGSVSGGWDSVQM